MTRGVSGETPQITIERESRGSLRRCLLRRQTHGVASFPGASGSNELRPWGPWLESASPESTGLSSFTVTSCSTSCSREMGLTGFDGDLLLLRGRLCNRDPAIFSGVPVGIWPHLFFKILLAINFPDVNGRGREPIGERRLSAHVIYPTDFCLPTVKPLVRARAIGDLSRLVVDCSD